MDPVKNAVSMFNTGYSCSQAILASFAPQFGLDRDLAIKMAGPFGGGIARQGLQCGSISGAIMVLGLHSGRLDPEDAATRDKNDKLVREFMARFQDKHGSFNCNQLTGVDISDFQTREKAQDDGVYDRICPNLVGFAAELVQELIGNR